MAGQTQSARLGAVGNRWLIAAAGVVMQIALGAVYAWSVFGSRSPRSSAGRSPRSP
jgi:OFA family oxalate/formate antiporter-like MFS transporter